MKKMIATMGALALMTTSTMAAAAAPVLAGSSLPTSSATSADSLAFSRAVVQQGDESELRGRSFPIFALIGAGLIILGIVIAATSGNNNNNGNSPG